MANSTTVSTTECIFAFDLGKYKSANCRHEAAIR